MNKKDFILRQLSRANHKRYENYVVTRIWHLLNNPAIKFVTQQLVLLSDGRRALTDVYFPQINLHVEVDEPHHLNQIGADAERQLGIVNRTNHKLIRINTEGKELESIHGQVNQLLIEINKLWIEMGSPIWDVENEFSRNKYITKGYVHSDDNDDFRKIVDACNSFGCNYEVFQRATCTHPIEENTKLWFPKLFNSRDWMNKLSECEEFIYETRTRDQEMYFNDAINKNEQIKRLVFAYFRDNLGFSMYRFKGVYQFDKKLSEENHKVTYKRVARKAKTYSYQN